MIGLLPDSRLRRFARFYQKERQNSNENPKNKTNWFKMIKMDYTIGNQNVKTVLYPQK
jgi:hypothetical protein